MPKAIYIVEVKIFIDNVNPVGILSMFQALLSPPGSCGHDIFRYIGEDHYYPAIFLLSWIGAALSSI